MSLSILSNSTSVAAQRHLSKSQRGLNSALSKLASGLRVVSAADDAAGLAISENLRAQVRSLAVARRNASDGISLAQTAESALNETHGMLMRMRELAVQSANGTLSSAQRDMLNAEFSALQDEIDRVAAVTEFNGTFLLDGSGTTLDLQVGTENDVDDRISIDLAGADATAATLGVDAGSISVDGADATNALAAITAIDAAIDTVSGIRSDFGVSQNQLEATINRLHSAEENLGAAESRIRDADIAAETSAFTRGQILMQAGVAMLAQANQLPSIAMSLIG